MDADQQKRHAMVHEQIEARRISDAALLASMRSVPRHLFVPKEVRQWAYEDFPLSIGEGQTISQPYIVALMIELAGVHPHDRALEVGTGCGYSAAVLSSLVSHVYSVECVLHLAQQAQDRLHHLGYRNISVKQGDGSVGWKEMAPYDAILVTAASPSVPQALKEQLSIQGRLVIPVGSRNSQVLVRITRIKKTHWEEESLLPVRFVPLIGQQGWEEELPPLPPFR